MTKTKILAFALATIASTSAYAGGLSGGNLEPHFYIAAEAGQADADLKAFNYGAKLGSDIVINDNQHVDVSVFVKQSVKKEDVSLKQIGTEVDYKYDFSAGEMKISPVVGLGYVEQKFSGADDNLKRVYAKVGLEGNIKVGDDWSLIPAVSYSRDLHSKVTEGESGVTSKNKGHAFKASFGVHKQFVEGGLTVTPFIDHYTNKFDGESYKIRQTGVELKYTF